MFKGMSKTLQGKFETHDFSEFAASWVKQTLRIHPSSPLTASNPDSVTTQHALSYSSKEHLEPQTPWGPDIIVDLLWTALDHHKSKIPCNLWWPTLQPSEGSLAKATWR